MVDPTRPEPWEILEAKRLRWEALWIAMAEAAKEWFILHSLKRRHWPPKIRARYERGEYPAQPGSYAGMPIPLGIIAESPRPVDRLGHQ